MICCGSLMLPSRSMLPLAPFRIATATLARDAAQCSPHPSDTGKSPADSHLHKARSRARGGQAATLRRFRLGKRSAMLSAFSDVTSMVFMTPILFCIFSYYFGCIVFSTPFPSCFHCRFERGLSMHSPKGVDDPLARASAKG